MSEVQTPVRRGRPPKTVPALGEINETNEPAEPKKTENLTLEQKQARAKQRQQLDTLKRRKESPEGMEVGMFVGKSPDREAQEMYCPEAIDRKDANGNKIPGTMSTFTDIPENLQRRVNEGWEPLYDPYGKLAMCGGDIMFKRPREISDAHKAEVVARSARRMTATDAQFDEVAEDAAESGAGRIQKQVTEVSKVSLDEPVGD